MPAKKIVNGRKSDWYKIPAMNIFTNLPKLAGIGLIRLYRYTLSSFMGRGCRYAPTCSEYTEEAIRTYGMWAGGWIGLSRILRCNPWGPSGYDPVPDHLPKGRNWYRPWRYGHWTGAHIKKEHRLD